MTELAQGETVQAGRTCSEGAAGWTPSILSSLLGSVSSLEAVASNHYALVHWSVNLGFFPSYRTELNLALKQTGLCFELCSYWYTWRGLYSPTVLTPHFSTIFLSPLYPHPFQLTIPDHHTQTLSVFCPKETLPSLNCIYKETKASLSPSHLLTIRSGDQL